MSLQDEIRRLREADSSRMFDVVRALNSINLQVSSSLPQAAIQDPDAKSLINKLKTTISEASALANELAQLIDKL